MTTEQYIKTGKACALISLLCGTIIFGVYLLTSSTALLFIGYAFIVLAGLTNLVMLFAILLRAGTDKRNRNRLLKTAALMLINIPVAFVYCWIVMTALETLRITFINNTGTDLTDIHIVGCSGGHIGHLQNGESKTLFISITGDCSIYIDYLWNGQRKEEQVADYVTAGMGKKVNYEIGQRGNHLH